MRGRISNIAPFLLITILSFISVEVLYQALEYFVFKTPVVSQKVRPERTVAVSTEKKSVKNKPDYRVILKRNLFARPENDSAAVKPVATEEAIQEKAELGLVLMGTISGNDNNNRAFILTKDTRDQELYSIGEVVEGALIKDIQRGKLVLSIDGREMFLDMSEAAEMRPVHRAPKKSTKVRGIRKKPTAN